MAKQNSTIIAVFTLLVVFATGTMSACAGELKSLNSLERCQQRQYKFLLKSHETISDLADTSDDKAELAKKQGDKLHSLHKHSKAKLALSKEIKNRKRQGALLSVDSSILSLIGQVLNGKTKVAKYKARLKKNRGYKNEALLSEIASGNEQVDQNYSEISMKSYILKLKTDREFQSCVVGQPAFQASL